MTETVEIGWSEVNQQYLVAALQDVREALERHGGGVLPEVVPGPSPEVFRVLEYPSEDRTPVEIPTALETLCRTFSLSEFERFVLLLCAGVELDGSLAQLCSSAQGGTHRLPTFSLALSLFPGAHWSALSPGSPLRYWHLIEVGSGESLASSPLRIDEFVLHFLAGVQAPDAHLSGLVRPVHVESDALVPTHRALADAVVAVWSGSSLPLPVIQLCGNDPAEKRRVAAAAARGAGWRLHVLPAHLLPASAGEMEILARLWERQAVLFGSALLLDCESAGPGDAEPLLNHFLEYAGGPLLMARRERRSFPHRTTIPFDVRRPTMQEQRALWHQALRDEDELQEGDVDRLVAHFDVGASSIEMACTRARATPEGGTPGERLWTAARIQARPRLDELAERIEPVATWDDLVLPVLQHRILQDVVLHVRQRTTVYEQWGFKARSNRGLGISALFAGASGTGKTMAAEVLAGALRLDLYRIDLSRVVSKYIGETEKNLSRVFDAAEEGGAILLFDEADALFGKRTEVKDSHDRYANIEVSYLLQRMESYRGLAILTTNMKGAIDDAFMRRIRFVVTFPFPDATQRAEIWRHIFPEETPRNGLVVEKLARLNVTGGNIRNIALNAAFLAADAREPVGMRHLLQAARTEYAKLEKPLTDAEVRGWV